MMTLMEQFLAVVDAYAAARGQTDSQMGVRLFNDWRRITLLRSGRDQTTRSHERRLQWLSDNWPPGLPWPEGAFRPAPSIPPDATRAQRRRALRKPTRPQRDRAAIPEQETAS